MIALIIVIFILIITDVAILVSLFVFIRIFIVGLKATLCLVVSFSSKSSFSLTHLIEPCILIFTTFVFKDLIFLILHMLVLQLLNDLLLLGTTLGVLQVVHIQLIFKVVDVSVLLHIGTVESLKFGLEALIFFLEFRLDILNTLKALVGAFELDTASLDRVLKDGLVTAEGLNSFLHLFHLACLCVDNVSDAFFNVLLLSILIKVAAD